MKVALVVWYPTAYIFPLVSTATPLNWELFGADVVERAQIPEADARGSETDPEALAVDELSDFEQAIMAIMISIEIKQNLDRIDGFMLILVWRTIHYVKS